MKIFQICVSFRLPLKYFLGGNGRIQKRVRLDSMTLGGREKAKCGASVAFVVSHSAFAATSEKHFWVAMLQVFANWGAKHDFAG